MPTHVTPYDHYLLAMIVVVGTYLGLAFMLWLAQRSRHAPFIRSFRGIAQNFLTVINVIFALNLVFLANDTWSAHDRARDSVFQEAGSLASILDLASGLPEPLRAPIEGDVRTYVRLAVTTEWPLLARRGSSGEVTGTLDGLLARLASPDVAAALPATVHAQMLAQAIDVRGTRNQRVALSQTHVNPLKWLGMAFLGLLTMVSIVMVHVDQPRAQFLSALLFATAAAPSAAIVLVHGNPFQPPMAVSSQPIAAVIETAPPGTGGVARF
jgi:uncharacterized membrane protein